MIDFTYRSWPEKTKKKKKKKKKEKKKKKKEKEKTLILGLGSINPKKWPALYKNYLSPLFQSNHLLCLKDPPRPQKIIDPFARRTRKERLFHRSNGKRREQRS